MYSRHSSPTVALLLSRGSLIVIAAPLVLRSRALHMLRLLLLLSIGIAAVLAIAVLLSVACLSISTGLLWLLVGVLLLVAGLAVIIVVVLFPAQAECQRTERANVAGGE